LKLQIPLTDDAPDELLFIVVHQSYELWFKVMVDELKRAASVLHDNEPWRAVSHLRRMVEIEELLLTHLRLLDTMSPKDSWSFVIPRPRVGLSVLSVPCIEFLSGGGRKACADFEFFDDEQREWLRAISEMPSVWAGFEHSLRVTMGAASDEDLIDVVRALYLSHTDAARTALHAVAELLMDHDENLAVWRHQHMLMAGRQIGRRPGTGGSEGMAYLDTTLNQRLYPALWEVRSVL